MGVVVVTCRHYEVLRRLVGEGAVSLDGEGLVTGTCGCGVWIQVKPGRREVISYFAGRVDGVVEVRRVPWRVLMDGAVGSSEVSQECGHRSVLLDAVPGFVRALRGASEGVRRVEALGRILCVECGQRVRLRYEGGDCWYQVRSDGSLRVLREGPMASPWHMLREARAFRRERWARQQRRGSSSVGMHPGGV